MLAKEKGEKIKPHWNMRGNTPLLSRSDVDNVVDELSTKGGFTIGRETIAEKIRSAQESKIISSRRVPLSKIDYHPNATTDSNYTSLVALQDGLLINSKSIPKSVGLLLILY